MKTSGNEIQEVVKSRKYWRSRTALMWQMFFLAAFFGTYHTFLIGFRSGPCGGQTEQWNVIPLLPVFSDSRSANQGTVILKVPLFSARITGFASLIVYLATVHISCCKHHTSPDHQFECTF